MEDEYLRTVQKHTAGKPGKRGCDSISRMFAELVLAMEQDSREQFKDIMGDLFQGAITYGEAGQFLTPMPVCELMAGLTIGLATDSEVELSASDTDTSIIDVPQSSIEPESKALAERRHVHDPCCGSGRMLLAAAKLNRHWDFIGQDVDIRCVRMTALNLAFRNLYEYVIWGNTLALEKKLVYRTGFDGCGFVREIPLGNCPTPVQGAVNTPSVPGSAVASTDPLPSSSGKGRQLELF